MADPLLSLSSLQQPAQWMRDSASQCCLICTQRFNPLTRRRHHCRSCYKLVCASCSSNEASLPLPPSSNGPFTGASTGVAGPQRVCDQCYVAIKNSGGTVFSNGGGGILPYTREGERRAKDLLNSLGVDLGATLGMSAIAKSSSADAILSSREGPHRLIVKGTSWGTGGPDFTEGLMPPSGSLSPHRPLPTPPPALHLSSLVGTQSVFPPFILHVRIGRACLLPLGAPAVASSVDPGTTSVTRGWYCSLRLPLSKEPVWVTTVAANRGRWATWNETITVRIPVQLQLPLQALHLVIEVLEKGRKMNGDVLLSQARVPLSFALRSASTVPTQKCSGGDVQVRLIDPTTTVDAGRMDLRLWADFGAAIGPSPRDPVMMHELFPPQSSLWPSLFLPSGPLSASLNTVCEDPLPVPFGEVVIDAFESAHLQLKNSRAQRIRPGQLLVTSHRLVHLPSGPIHDDQHLHPQLPHMQLQEASIQIPLASMAGIAVRARGAKSQTPVLEVTCKNQLTYVYHIHAAATPRAPSMGVPQLSNPANDPPTSGWTEPPQYTSEVDRLLIRLRSLQEEVLWRISEDEFAFPYGRSRYFVTSDDGGSIDSPAPGMGGEPLATPRSTEPTVPTTQEASAASPAYEAPYSVSDLDWMAELRRLGLAPPPPSRTRDPSTPSRTAHRGRSIWRVTQINERYRFCASYPSVLVVPAHVTDAQLKESAKFRCKARIPVVTWVDPVTGAALCRSSQPLVGLTSAACVEDDTLLMQIRATAWLFRHRGDDDFKDGDDGNGSGEAEEAHQDAVCRDLDASMEGGELSSGQWTEVVRTGKDLGLSIAGREEVVGDGPETESSNGHQQNGVAKGPLTADSTAAQAGLGRVSFSTGQEHIILGGESPSTAGAQVMSSPSTCTADDGSVSLRSLKDDVGQESGGSRPCGNGDDGSCGRGTCGRHQQNGSVMVSSVYYDAENSIPGSPFSDLQLTPPAGPLHMPPVLLAPHPLEPHPEPILRIMDARPVINAVGNAFLGKGSEVISRLGGEECTTLEYLNVGNIHVMRESYSMLVAACHEHADDDFFKHLNDSKWLQHVSTILKGSVMIARYLTAGDPVLVHCSDGWDRTTQLATLAQLMLDPYYRTIKGFQVLIEKDWCAFGHQFRMRTGSDAESAPIFVQFLDAVYQLLTQFPTAFEFTDRLLLLLADAVQSRWFKNFLHDSDLERSSMYSSDFTQQAASGDGATNWCEATGQGPKAWSVWDVVSADLDSYRNVLYARQSTTASTPTPTHGHRSWGRDPQHSVMHLKPYWEVSRLSLWREMYFRDSIMRLAGAERWREQLLQQPGWAAAAGERVTSTRVRALEARVLSLEQQLRGSILHHQGRVMHDKIREVQGKLYHLDRYMQSLVPPSPFHHPTRPAANSLTPNRRTCTPSHTPCSDTSPAPRSSRSRTRSECEQPATGEDCPGHPHAGAFGNDVRDSPVGGCGRGCRRSVGENGGRVSGDRGSCGCGGVRAAGVGPSGTVSEAQRGAHDVQSVGRVSARATRRRSREEDAGIADVVCGNAVIHPRYVQPEYGGMEGPMSDDLQRQVDRDPLLNRLLT